MLSLTKKNARLHRAGLIHQTARGRLFGGFGSLRLRRRFGFSRFLELNRQIHPFENRFFAGITPLAARELDDPGVSTVTPFLSGGNLIEENVNGIFLVKSSCRQASMMNRAAFAESDHFFRDGPGGFGFRQRGRDSFVLDQAANQVREHRVAMRAGSAQLSGSFKVAHRSRNDWHLRLFLRRVQQGRINVHSQRETEALQFVFDFVQRLFTEIAVLEHLSFSLQS